MLQSLQVVWDTFGDIIGSLPGDVVIIGAFSVCGILLIGFLRSL